MPHEINAHLYDHVYRQSFGAAYELFTQATLQLLEPFLGGAPVTIVDYGAGTGRLAFPLAARSHVLEAVERNAAMCSAMRARSEQQAQHPRIHESSIADYTGPSGDLALAVFTVLNYITTAEEMRASWKNMAAKLNANGCLIIDLPVDQLFSGQYQQTWEAEGFKRFVRITATAQDDIFHYQEICSGQLDGAPFEYTMGFPLRQWRLDELVAHAREFGLQLGAIDASGMEPYGAHYYRFVKAQDHAASAM
jgi:SAM-dependent methyltransferase